MHKDVPIENLFRAKATKRNLLLSKSFVINEGYKLTLLEKLAI